MRWICSVTIALAVCVDASSSQATDQPAFIGCYEDKQGDRDLPVFFCK